METPNPNRSCAVCGKEVIDHGDGNIAHVEGGEVEQKCKNPACEWKGGQVGKFSQCPRCGDGTQLVDDHRAS